MEKTSAFPSTRPAVTDGVTLKAGNRCRVLRATGHRFTPESKNGMTP
jgi:hypothetical protein